MQKPYLVEELVINDSFISFCFLKNSDDVKDWENYLLLFPEEKFNVEEAKSIVQGITLMLHQIEDEASISMQEAAGKQEPARKDEGKLGRVYQLKRYGIIRPMFRKWLSVAAIIVVMLTASLVYVFSSRQPAAPVASINHQSTKDVNPPSAVNAVITLSNGQQLVLDSLNAGQITAQANAQIVKSADGQIIYKAESSAPLAYNTLFVPRGSKIVNLTLSDGTRVWLNSESTLKYPVAFSGKERKVEINGEAYFEVAHRNGQPFKVQKGDMCVTVLGTHFNVNSYDDEPDVKVTLLEGSVKINNGDEVGMLKPGQQARIASGMTINSNADVAEAIAWKEGFFQFGDAAGITTIMRQLARWYNVEIIYEGAVNGYVGGSIARDIPVSQALKMLAMTGEFSYKIEGNKVLIKEKK